MQVRRRQSTLVLFNRTAVAVSSRELNGGPGINSFKRLKMLVVLSSKLICESLFKVYVCPGNLVRLTFCLTHIVITHHLCSAGTFCRLGARKRYERFFPFYRCFSSDP